MDEDNTAPPYPAFEDFPGAECVGGAVIVDGQTMGYAQTDGSVVTTPVGDLYLQEQRNAAAREAISAVPHAPRTRRRKHADAPTEPPPEGDSAENTESETHDYT